MSTCMEENTENIQDLINLSDTKIIEPASSKSTPASSSQLKEKRNAKIDSVNNNLRDNILSPLTPTTTKTPSKARRNNTLRINTRHHRSNSNTSTNNNSSNSELIMVRSSNSTSERPKRDYSIDPALRNKYIPRSTNSTPRKGGPNASTNNNYEVVSKLNQKLKDMDDYINTLQSKYKLSAPNTPVAKGTSSLSSSRDKTCNVPTSTKNRAKDRLLSLRRTNSENGSSNETSLMKSAENRKKLSSLLPPSSSSSSASVPASKQTKSYEKILKDANNDSSSINDNDNDAHVGDAEQRQNKEQPNRSYEKVLIPKNNENRNDCNNYDNDNDNNIVISSSSSSEDNYFDFNNSKESQNIFRSKEADDDDQHKKNKDKKDESRKTFTSSPSMKINRLNNNNDHNTILLVENNSEISIALDNNEVIAVSKCQRDDELGKEPDDNYIRNNDEQHQCEKQNIVNNQETTSLSSNDENADMIIENNNSKEEIISQEENEEEKARDENANDVSTTMITPRITHHNNNKNFAATSTTNYTVDALTKNNYNDELLGAIQSADSFITTATTESKTEEMLIQAIEDKVWTKLYNLQYGNYCTMNEKSISTVSCTSPTSTTTDEETTINRFNQHIEFLKSSFTPQNTNDNDVMMVTTAAPDKKMNNNHSHDHNAYGLQDIITSSCTATTNDYNNHNHNQKTNNVNNNSDDDECIEALANTKDDANYINNDDAIDINATMSSLSLDEHHNKDIATTITTPTNKETISSPKHEMNYEGLIVNNNNESANSSNAQKYSLDSNRFSIETGASPTSLDDRYNSQDDDDKYDKVEENDDYFSIGDNNINKEQQRDILHMSTCVVESTSTSSNSLSYDANDDNTNIMKVVDETTATTVEDNDIERIWHGQDDEKRSLSSMPLVLPSLTVNIEESMSYYDNNEEIEIVLM